MEREAAFFRMLGEATRLRLLVLLAVRGEMCVCHLSDALGGPQYRISRHLAVLRAAGLVEARREGTWMHYRLAVADEGLGRSVMDLLAERLGDDPGLLCRSGASGRNCCGLKKNPWRTRCSSDHGNSRGREQ